MAARPPRALEHAGPAPGTRRACGRREKPILNVHYAVEQYVTQPHWGVSVELSHFQVDPLLPLARHLGVALPEDLQLTGLADGVLSYSDRRVSRAHASFHQTKFALPARRPLNWSKLS